MYIINHRNGNTDMTSTFKAACERIKDQYPNARIGHDGDLSDGGDRTLVWATFGDGTDDDGSNAVASIQYVEDSVA